MKLNQLQSQAIVFLWIEINQTGLFMVQKIFVNRCIYSSHKRLSKLL